MDADILAVLAVLMGLIMTIIAAHKHKAKKTRKPLIGLPSYPQDNRSKEADEERLRLILQEVGLQKATRDWLRSLGVNVEDEE